MCTKLSTVEVQLAEIFHGWNNKHKNVWGEFVKNKVGKVTEEHINCAAEAASKAKETLSIKLVGILEKKHEAWLGNWGKVELAYLRKIDHTELILRYSKSHKTNISTLLLAFLNFLAT